MHSYFNASPIVRTRSSSSITDDFSAMKNALRVNPLTNSSKLRRTNSIGHAINYYNPASLSAFQAIRETDQRTKVRQNLATTKLRERTQDIDYWRSELNSEIRAMELEQNQIKEVLSLMEMALAHTARPMQISEECLMHREKRVGIDQVKDEVERSLGELDEADICFVKKNRLNRAAQHEMEKDVKDKMNAYEIDTRIYTLNHLSPGLALFPGVELTDNTLSVPKSWIRFTQENLARSQRQRANSERLRCSMDNLMRQISGSIHNQFALVNNALATRIQETSDARDKLRASLQAANLEKFDVENAIQVLKRSMEEKIPPLKLAETRLEERTRRLNVEACRDVPMKVLQREVVEIRDSMRALKAKLREAEVILARLNKSISSLQNEINVKENSLIIDQKMCLGMRKSFPLGEKRNHMFSLPVSY
ncbi:tektin 5 [Cichlidogyrus casuarinus]|uniref:Tektin n=1 Tax=Cichlidogyrus casuarinus TaxID=1844966 RepID=A0ABD2Q6X7_9PLAT